MSTKEKEKSYTKKPIIEESPEIFPSLTKRVLNLDDLISTDQFAQKLGTYAIFLNNLKKKSVYKKLLSDTKHKDFQNMREIRNKYLKRLVESNPFYFPKELGLDEYKKSTISKEDKINNLIKHLEEIAKKEKLGNDVASRKTTSNNLIQSRKESLLDNKRKRTESIYEEIDNKKKEEERKRTC